MIRGKIIQTVYLPPLYTMMCIHMYEHFLQATVGLVFNVAFCLLCCFSWGVFCVMVSILCFFPFLVILSPVSSYQ